MSPEYLAISGLFAVLQSFATAVIVALWNDNKRLREQLDESNQASKDLIAVQAKLLEARGVQIVPFPSEEEV